MHVVVNGKTGVGIRVSRGLETYYSLLDRVRSEGKVFGPAAPSPVSVGPFSLTSKHLVYHIGS